MKRKLCIFVLLAMLFTLLPCMPITATAATVGATVTADTSWYTVNPSADEFYIADAADLLGLRDLIADPVNNNLFCGKIIHITNNIDLNPAWDASSSDVPANQWCTLTAAHDFAGTIEGHGHTVKGFYQVSSEKSAGLFGRAWGDNVVVKDLTILNSYSESSSADGHGALFGVLLASCHAEFTNVYVDMRMVNTGEGSNSYGIGGFVGGVEYHNPTDKKNQQLNTTVFMNGCVFAGDINVSGNASYVGGFIGRTNDAGDKIFTDCAFYGSIEGTLSASTVYAGGLVGYVSQGSSYTTQHAFTNCIVAGAINLDGNAVEGAVCGALKNAVNKATVSNVFYTDGAAFGGSYTGSSNVTGTATKITDTELTGVAARTLLTGEGFADWTPTTKGYPLPKGVYAMLDLRGGTADTASVSVWGYQPTYVSEKTFDFRLVGTLKLEEGKTLSDYDAIGFSFVANLGYDPANGENGVTKALEYSCATVYTSIKGNTEKGVQEYTAENLGGDYIFVLACTDIPYGVGDVTFEVTPRLTDKEGNTALGATVVGVVTAPLRDEDITLLKDYTVVTSDADMYANYSSGYNTKINTFVAALKEKTGVDIAVVDADTSSAVSEKELLIGHTDRAESDNAFDTTPYTGISVGFANGKLTVMAYRNELWQEAFDAILDALVQNSAGEWGLPNGFSYQRNAVDVTEAIPKPETDSGKLIEGYFTGDDEFMTGYLNLTAAEYNAYLSALEDAGFTQYTANNVANSHMSATYVTDHTEVHLIWQKAVDGVTGTSAYEHTLASYPMLRIVIGPRGDLPTQSEPAYTKLINEARVTQIARIGVKDGAPGMLFVVQLLDGSFVVIDGGYSHWQDRDALLTFLQNNKPASHAKPQVTWMLTHAHSDHVALALDFLTMYSDRIELERVCYNFPQIDSIKWNSAPDKSANTYANGIYRALDSVLEREYPNAEVLVFHAGQKLYLPGCEIEILATHESVWPHTIYGFNDTSASWRMTFTQGTDTTADDTTFTVLGDSDTGLCELLTGVYGDYLKSDVLQATHHGQWGATVALYEAIDPSIVYWANSVERMKPENTATPNVHAYEASRWLLYSRLEKKGDYHGEETVTVNMQTLEKVALNVSEDAFDFGSEDAGDVWNWSAE